MKNPLLAIFAAVLMLALAAPSALAASFSAPRVSAPSVSVKSPSISSSGSKSYSSGGGSKSSSSSSSYGKSVSSAKPSSGPKTAPPVTKTLPKAPPAKLAAPSFNGKPRVAVPAGRSHSKDYATVSRNRNYYDPYRSGYYGMDTSPFFYLWLFSAMDDDPSNNALPGQAPEGQIAPSVLSYMGVAEAIAQDDDLDQQTELVRASLDRLNAAVAD